MTARVTTSNQFVLQPVALSRPAYDVSPASTTLNRDGSPLSGSSSVVQDSLQPLRLTSYPTGNMATVAWQRTNDQGPGTLRASSTATAEPSTHSQDPPQFWWISAEGLTNGRGESGAGPSIQRATQASRWSSSDWSSSSLERLSDGQVDPSSTPFGEETPSGHSTGESSSEDHRLNEGRAAGSISHTANPEFPSNIHRHSREYSHLGRTLPMIHLQEIWPTDGNEHTMTGSSTDPELGSSRASSETISSGYAGSSDSLGVPSVSGLSIAATNRISPLTLPSASAGVVPLNAFAPAFLLQHENASLMSLLSATSSEAQALRCGEPSQQNWLDMTSSFTSSDKRPNSGVSSASTSPYDEDSKNCSLPSGWRNNEPAGPHHSADASQPVCFPASMLPSYNDQLACIMNGIGSRGSNVERDERHRVAPQAMASATHHNSDLRDMYRAIQASAMEAVPMEDSFEILAEWVEQAHRLAQSRDQSPDDRCQSTTPQPCNRQAIEDAHTAHSDNDADTGSALPAKSGISFATPNHQQQLGEAARTESKSLLSSLLPRFPGSPTKSKLFSTLQKKTSASSNISLANAQPVRSSTVGNENLKRSSKGTHVHSHTSERSSASAAYHVGPSFSMQRGMVRPISIGLELPWAPYIEETVDSQNTTRQSRFSEGSTRNGSSSSGNVLLPGGTAATCGGRGEAGKVKRRWYESKDYTPPNVNGNTNEATMIVGRGTGKCSIAALKPQGSQETSTAYRGAAKQSDGSVISLNRFLAETSPPTGISSRASLDESQDDSRTPTPTRSSFGCCDRNTGASQRVPLPQAANARTIAIATQAAMLDRRGGANVVRTAKELDAGQSGALLLASDLLASGIGRGSIDSAPPKATSLHEHNRASSDTRAPAKPDRAPRSNNQPDAGRGASTLHLFPMPPPLRSSVGVGVDSPANQRSRSAIGSGRSTSRSLRYDQYDGAHCDDFNRHKRDEDYNDDGGREDEDDEDDDIFLQVRLSEPGQSPSFSRSQGSTMSIVLEEEEEEEEEEGGEGQEGRGEWEVADV